MCGIAGILRVHPPGTAVPPPLAAIPELWLDILDEAVKHRGPDGQGRFRDRAVRADGTVVDVALVHRRLSVLDHAGGAQPMVSRGASDAIAVLFNGCIYNHRKLRKELQAAGLEFVTDHSDTEVLVHGWRHWKAGLFPRLDGMFATVIWDRAAAQLVLARDAFGEKPLHLYHVHREGAWINAFASVPIESTPLRGQLGPSDVDILPQSSFATWVRFGCDHATPVQGASAVLPGSIVSYHHREGPWEALPEFMSEGAPAPTATPFGPLHNEVWFGTNQRRHNLSPEEVEPLLAAAVSARLDADVDLGCFLSGGIDSSLIALLAHRVKPDLRTFTVRMPDDRYDESPTAQAVANLIGTHHTTLDCHADPSADLVTLIRQIGVPFGDSSLLPTHWVARAAREHVTVSLSGDGGDELFLGYERFRAAEWMHSSLAQFGSTMLDISPGPDPRSKRAKLARFMNATRHEGYFDLLSIFPSSMMRELVHPDALEELGMPWQQGHIGDAGDAAAADALFYLPCDLMRKSDSAAMAVALEVRSPFLDSTLARTTLSSTVSSLMPGGRRKGLLREVARKHLPAEIVDRPKQGFAIPIGDWFRSDYGGMRQLLMDHLNSADPWGPASLGIDLNMKFVRQMLDEHMGTGVSGRVVRDHSQRLYMLLVLSIWAKWMGSLS